MESLYNNQKKPTAFFFITKVVNFVNERPCICSISSIHIGQDCRYA